LQQSPSLCCGIVIKINSKTLTIYLTTEETWRVSPSIVKKATSPNKELLKLKESFLNPMDRILSIPEINCSPCKQRNQS
jgi:hypothetical protein